MIDEIYEYIKKYCEDDLFIPESYIIRLVGIFGLDILNEQKLIELSRIVGGIRCYKILRKER